MAATVEVVEQRATPILEVAPPEVQFIPQTKEAERIDSTKPLKAFYDLVNVLAQVEQQSTPNYQVLTSIQVPYTQDYSASTFNEIITQNKNGKEDIEREAPRYLPATEFLGAPRISLNWSVYYQGNLSEEDQVPDKDKGSNVQQNMVDGMELNNLSIDGFGDLFVSASPDNRFLVMVTDSHFEYYSPEFLEHAKDVLSRVGYPIEIYNPYGERILAVDGEAEVSQGEFSANGGEESHDAASYEDNSVTLVEYRDGIEENHEPVNAEYKEYLQQGGIIDRESFELIVKGNLTEIMAYRPLKFDEAYFMIVDDYLLREYERVRLLKQGPQRVLEEAILLQSVNISHALGIVHSFDNHSKVQLTENQKDLLKRLNLIHKPDLNISNGVLPKKHPHVEPWQLDTKAQLIEVFKMTGDKKQLELLTKRK